MVPLNNVISHDAIFYFLTFLSRIYSKFMIFMNRHLDIFDVLFQGLCNLDAIIKFVFKRKHQFHFSWFDWNIFDKYFFLWVNLQSYFSYRFNVFTMLWNYKSRCNRVTAYFVAKRRLFLPLRKIEVLEMKTQILYLPNRERVWK